MTGAQAAGLPGREADGAAASAVKAMQAEGRLAEARERYAELVGRHQRRAVRIALHYMRDAAEADEAVQDAFVKAYAHLDSFREELPFEVWFTRILINGCLDRIKARTRRGALVRTDAGGPGRPTGFRRADRREGTVAGGTAARERTAGGARASARQAPRAAAVGVHAESLRRLHVPGSERDDRSQRIDGPRSPVPRDSQASRPACGRRPVPDAPWRNAVSILNRLRLNSHLDDAAIAAIWTDSTLDGSRASHPHLGVCTACRTRFDLFSECLDELRDDAAAQADELFPAERLAVQHAQIFRRIEASERPARVIAFPRFRRRSRPRTSHASRWIAAAAAAGLIVGVGVGQVMDLRHIGSVSPAPYPGAPVGTATARWRSNRAGGGDLQRRRRRSVPLRSRRLALPAVGSGAPRDRRVDAAGRRTATVAVATSQPLIFRKGLDLKEAVAGVLADGLSQRHRRPRQGRRLHVTTPAG